MFYYNYNLKLNFMKFITKLKSLYFKIRSLIIKAFPNVSIIKHNNVELKLHNINYLTDYRIRTFASKEPETLEWIDKFDENSVFYDIGANVGLYSIYAAKKKESQVYSFEPSILNLDLLFKNIDENNLNNKISILPIALNDKNIISRFNLSDLRKAGALSSFGKEFDHLGKKLLIQKYYYTLGMSIDDLVKIFNLKKPDYLKIDVDGIEHLILNGGLNLVSNPKVKEFQIEVSENFKEQKNTILKIMKENGFSLKSMRSSLRGVVNNEYSTRNYLFVRKI